MNRRLLLTAMVAVLLILATLTGLAHALAGGYSLDWWSVDGGGGSSSANASYSLSGSAGQPDAGLMTGTGYQLAGGFWTGLVPASASIYLPLLTR